MLKNNNKIVIQINNMTYRTYRITSRNGNDTWIKFGLNGSVEFSGGYQDYIYCAVKTNNHPTVFNAYQVGDEVEIDITSMKRRGGSDDIENSGLVRPTISSSNQQLIRRMRAIDDAATEQIVAGREFANDRTGDYRGENVSYNQHTGDYYYEYIEYTKKT
jgi:hypothetical protein